MKKLLYILLFSVFLLGMTPKDISIIDELRVALKTVTDERDALKAEKTAYQAQDKDNRIALEPIRFVTEKKNNSSFWAKNPDHLKSVWKWTKQYRTLLTPEAEATAKTFNVEYFVFCWFFKETHYDPYAENKNKNGTFDWGMAQINDVCWNECYTHLPAELKKKNNPKKDPEVAVAMIYIWINHRVEMKWSYCFLSGEAWELYWRLGQI